MASAYGTGMLTGVLLELDLGRRIPTRVDPPDPDAEALVFGGSFLGLCVLAHDTLPGGRPPVVVAPSVLCGTPLGPLARTAVVGMSRTFAGAADPQAGGRFGGALRACGVAGLIIRGVADAPTLVTVSGPTAEDVAFMDAADLWGMDVPASHAALVLRAARPGGGSGSSSSTSSVRATVPSTLVIGPAGEVLDSAANVTLDSSFRCNRGGLGAALGAAKLKGIVVAGPDSFQAPPRLSLADGWPWLYADLSDAGDAGDAGGEGGRAAGAGEAQAGPGPCPGCRATCGRERHPRELGGEAAHCDRMGLDAFAAGGQDATTAGRRRLQAPEESAVDGLAVCRFAFEPYPRALFSLDALARMVSDVTGGTVDRDGLVRMGRRRTGILEDLAAAT